MEYQVNWQVVVTLISLATLFGFFIRPIVTITKTLTKLMVLIDVLTSKQKTDHEWNVREIEKLEKIMEDHKNNCCRVKYREGDFRDGGGHE